MSKNPVNNKSPLNQPAIKPEKLPASDYVKISKKKFKKLQEKNLNRF